MLSEYVPVLFLLVLGLLVGVVMIGMSWVLGPRTRNTPIHDSVYESGIVPTGSARQRFDVKFYIIAMLFILFDVEIVFIFPWAVLFEQLGGAGLLVMSQFLLILLVGLLYEWKKGALDWD